MQKSRNELLYVLLFIVFSVGCKTASVNFLGFFEKDITNEAKVKNNDTADLAIPEKFLKGALSISTSFGFGEYFEEPEKIALYITNSKGDKILPDSTTNNTVFHFNNVAFAEYVVNVLYNNVAVYKEPLTFINNDNGAFDIVITTQEQEVPIVKDLFTFDSEEFSVLQNGENATVIVQIQNGETYEEKEGIAFQLVGAQVYKAITDDGGTVIFEDIAAGEYEIVLTDEQNGITYNSQRSKITIHAKSQKDLSIYTFEGTLTDTSQIIYGVLEDFNSKQPIAGATISVLGTKQTHVTRADGSFTLKVGAGPQQIKFSKNEYISNCIRLIAVPNTVLSQSFYLVKPSLGFAVDKNGLQKTIANNILLNVPQGALNNDTTISITLLPEGTYFIGFQSGISIPDFHIEPSGLGFIKPISLSFTSVGDIDDYEEGETLLINVFSNGESLPNNKLEAKKEGNKLVVSINKINSSYSLSTNSLIHPQNKSAQIGVWKDICRYSDTVNSYERKFPQIWCQNNPFMPQKKLVKKFVLATDCWDDNVDCDTCAKKMRKRGVKFGFPATCKKTIDCAAPNCKRSYLVVVTNLATSTGTYQEKAIRLKNGNIIWEYRLIRDKPLPKCWDWSQKWVNSTCCNGQKCNAKMPNVTDKCVEWYCDEGECKSRPTALAKYFAERCYECNPNTGERGIFLCDTICKICVAGVCKPIKFYHVKTESVTTQSIHCPPTSSSTNTVVTVAENEVGCPTPELPQNSNNTNTIIGAHDCEKTIITTTIIWSIKQVNP